MNPPLYKSPAESADHASGGTVPGLVGAAVAVLFYPGREREHALLLQYADADA